VAAEIALADGAEDGIGERVRHGVGVAVTGEAACALDDYAAEDEGSVRIV
jgi:hypothetical protein